MVTTPEREDTTSRPERPKRAISRLLALIRNTWRTLTSMGTALVLLFLLALAAIPGALLPQRSLNESKVAEYIAEHPTLGPWLDRLQAFDVFSSFWFTAIYVLLFVSLVGCLTPRMVEHVRSLRATPVPAPRNLGREYGDRFNAIYPELAAKHDVPLYPFFLEGVALDPKLNQEDGMHPNAKGVAIVVDGILPHLTALIDGLPGTADTGAKGK